MDPSGLEDTAAGCPALQQARTLAPWVGANGRAVTAGGVLRRAEVAAATAALGSSAYRAMRAVLRAESGDARRVGAALICEIVLDLPAIAEREQAIENAVSALPHDDAMAAWDSFRRGVFPEVAAAELLNWFGAMDGIVATPLGQWARGRLDGPDPSIADVQRPDPATTAVQLSISATAQTSPG